MENAIALPNPDEKLPAILSRRRDLIEVCVGYVLILIVIWTPRPWQQYLWLLAAAGIAGMIATSRDSLRSMGVRSKNFLRSLWVAGVALSLSAIAIAIAIRLHTLRTPGGPAEFVANFWSYTLWSGIQQFLLQGFFLLRFLRLVRNPRQAAVMAGALFALAHLPNPVLAGLTVVWGTVACLIFLRYRNLFPLAMAHAVLGITIAVAVPGPVDHNMRVGLGYLRYHRGNIQRRVQRSQSDQIASTVACVTAEAPTRRLLLQARP